MYLILVECSHKLMHKLCDLIIHSLFSTGDSRPDIQVGGQHKMLYDCTIKQNFKGVERGDPRSCRIFAIIRI